MHPIHPHDQTVSRVDLQAEVDALDAVQRRGRPVSAHLLNRQNGTNHLKMTTAAKAIAKQEAQAAHTTGALTTKPPPPTVKRWGGAALSKDAKDKVIIVLLGLPFCVLRGGLEGKRAVRGMVRLAWRDVLKHKNDPAQAWEQKQLIPARVEPDRDPLAYLRAGGWRLLPVIIRHDRGEGGGLLCLRVATDHTRPKTSLD